MNNSARPKAYGRSAIVALALAALTIIEFYIAIMLGSAIFLMLIALFKAVIVIHYFMHVSRLWSPEGER